MPLPPTPWLNPPDYTGAFVHGAQIGASAQEAQNRLAATFAEANARTQLAAQQHAAQLAHQEQMAQMQSQVRMQIANQRAMEQQQRIAIDSAYKESQIGVERERLKEAHTANQLNVTKWAQQTANRQRLAQMVQEAGGDQEKINQIYMEHGMELGLTPSQMTPVFKERAPAPVPTVFTGDKATGIPPALIGPTGVPYWPPGSGGGASPAMKAFAADPEAKSIQGQINNLNKLLLTPQLDAQLKKTYEDQRSALQDDLNYIRRGRYGIEEPTSKMEPGQVDMSQTAAASQRQSAEPVGHYDPAVGFVYRQGAGRAAGPQREPGAPPPLSPKDAADPKKVDAWFEAYKKAYPVKPQEEEPAPPLTWEDYPPPPADTGE